MKLSDKIILGIGIAGVSGICLGYALNLNYESKISQVEKKPLIKEFNYTSAKLKGLDLYTAMVDFRHEPERWAEHQKDFDRYQELRSNPQVISDQNEIKALYKKSGNSSKVILLSFFSTLFGLFALSAKNSKVVFPQGKLEEKVA